MRPLLKALLLAVLSCAYAAYWGRAAVVVAAAPLLWAIALKALGSSSSAVLKALLAFHAFYLGASTLVQLAVLGSVEPVNTLVTTVKLFTLSVCSIAVARLLLPLLTRRVCSSWAITSLLVAVRSAAEAHALLSDSIEAVRVNYGGPRARPGPRLLKAVLERLPELVLDATLRRFEVLVTLLPGSCGGRAPIDRGGEQAEGVGGGPRGRRPPAHSLDGGQAADDDISGLAQRSR